MALCPTGKIDCLDAIWLVGNPAGKPSRRRFVTMQTCHRATPIAEDREMPAHDVDLAVEGA